MSVDGPASYDSAPGIQTPSLVGEVLDNRYRLTKKLGEGGMGEVYAAEHLHIEKRYAIKLLRPEIVSNQEAVKRFYQEARSSSSIGHRNIIAIEDFGSLPDGRVYMCMELLDGAPLNDMIQHPMPVDRLLNILIQTGHGLAAAHAKGIVHRDMKPENVYVTVGPNGEDIPKLLDFGIAKVSGNDGQNHLTRTGTIFGTPFYMAPEQALGNPVDARTDIYAVGVIMYEVFAGSLPFQGESFMGILTQHITTEPEPVAQRAAKAGRQLPPHLAEIIARAMQKNPAQRYASMDECVNALIEVYRAMVGPGMSTYMEAFPVTSPHQVQRTPAPITGPMVYQPPTVPHQIPGPSGSNPAVGYDPGSSAVTAPKKSKVGLIIAILAVLAVGGGVTVFLVTQKDKGGGGGGSGTSSGSQIALVDPGSGSAKVTIPDKGSDHGSAATPQNGSAGSAAVGSNGSAGSAGSGKDPNPQNGSNQDGSNGSGSSVTPPVDAGVAILAPKVVKVLIKSESVGKFDIFENGKKIATGPEMISIEIGTPRKFVLKARGYKDKSVDVDGSIEDLSVALEAKPGTVIIHHPIGPGSGSNIVTQPPPPQTVDCSQRFVNGTKACVAQYCAGHKSDPRCDAE